MSDPAIGSGFPKKRIAALLLLVVLLLGWTVSNFWLPGPARQVLASLVCYVHEQKLGSPSTQHLLDWVSKPLLVSALADEKGAVYKSAKRALETMGKKAVPALQRIVRAKRLERQTELALLALAPWGSELQTLEPQLGEIFHAGEGRLKAAAACALIAAERGSLEQVVALTEFISTSIICEDELILCLRRLNGSLATAAIPALLQFINSDSYCHISPMLTVLREMQGNRDTLLSSLAALIGNGSAPAQIAALIFLNENSFVAKSKIGPLTELVRHDNELLAAQAAWALERIGARAAGALPLLYERVAKITQSATEIDWLLAVHTQSDHFFSAILTFESDSHKLIDVHRRRLKYLSPLGRYCSTLKNYSVVWHGLGGPLNAPQEQLQTPYAVKKAAESIAELGSFGLEARDALPELELWTETNGCGEIAESARALIRRLKSG